MDAAADIKRRIRTRMAWLEVSALELAERLGVAPGHLERYFAPGGGYDDPRKWGLRGGKVSLTTIASALGCDSFAFLPENPPGPLLD